MTSTSSLSELKSSTFYEYHHATKHTVEKLMSYGHRLDWANQPDPFLHFEGAPVVELPHEFRTSSANVFETIAALASNANAKGEIEVGFENTDLLSFVSNLLYYGTAISAWKQVVGTNHKWALRVNASSGNLHPTDTHVLIGRGSDTLMAGAYHYRVDEHVLEKRASGDLVSPILNRLGMDCAPPVVLCLTSIFFREAWKYRERAFRYCQHDMGHALAALSLSAASLGWTSRIVGLFPDQEIIQSLGLQSSNEKPLAFMLLAPSTSANFTPHTKPMSFSVDGEAASINQEISFSGVPSKLSDNEIDYPIIDRIYRATQYGFAETVEAAVRQVEMFSADGNQSGLSEPGLSEPGQIKACQPPIGLTFDAKRAIEIGASESVFKTIRSRRSAVDMDGETSMPREHLEYILRASTLGFAADFQGVDEVSSGVWKSSSNNHLIHLYLYVHRVNDLTPGLYYFDRRANQLVPLFLSDQREVAMSTSCFQDIACDGAFSISMIADFVTGFKLYRDRSYRLAHYEAGFIGQMLYLTARALGHDATGIGCFVDDAINNYLALDPGKEVIYNFTIGKAVFDPRLTTLPSYDFEAFNSK